MSENLERKHRKPLGDSKFWLGQVNHGYDAILKKENLGEGAVLDSIMVCHSDQDLEQYPEHLLIKIAEVSEQIADEFNREFIDATHGEGFRLSTLTVDLEARGWRVVISDQSKGKGIRNGHQSFEYWVWLDEQGDVDYLLQSEV